MVTGAQKADVIEQIMSWDSAGNFQVGPSSDGYPAGMVRPTDGQLIWFIDADAASKLSSSADSSRVCEES